MLRAGRFRHRLLDDQFLKTKGPIAHDCLQPFIEQWRKKQISDIEITTIYILIFCFLRRSQDFLGGPHNQKLDTVCSLTSRLQGKDVVAQMREVLPSEFKQAKSLARLDKGQNFVALFCSLSWRSIPFSVQQSITAWSTGRYPLHLMTDIPTPEEVLKMQAQGKRCLSMLIQKEEIINFVEEGRDVLGFIVHDLIHADHFFACPEKAQAQIIFSNKLIEVRKLTAIQSMLSQDRVFEKEFHYLMSDMNSVPLHLLKTLKAILLGFYKRREGFSLKGSLSASTEGEFLELFKQVLDPWKLSEEAFSASIRLNTVSYLGPQDDILLHQALL